MQVRVSSHVFFESIMLCSRVMPSFAYLIGMQGLGEVEPSGGEDIKKRWEIFAKKIKTLNLVMNIT